MWLDADFLSGPAQVRCQQRLIWREKWTEKFACRSVKLKVFGDYLLYNSTISCSFTGS